MIIEALTIKLLRVLGQENVFINEPMKNHTTFRIGGPADLLVTPLNEVNVAFVVNICRENKIPFYVIGNGSNLLVSDKGVRGLVIKLFKGFSDIVVDGNNIKAKAGAVLSNVAAIAAKHGLSGMEFAAGIPGTIGGAILMNAGAYCREMKDVIVKTKFLDTENSFVECEEHEFSYRSSIFQKNAGIIVETEMVLKRKPSQQIFAEMQRLSRARRDKQPLNYPSAGSAFKRPCGSYAAKLIDDAGLRGFAIGGAQISQKHAGFVINTGNATSEDVCLLMDFVRDKVFDKFGVTLQREVRFLGEV